MSATFWNLRRRQEAAKSKAESIEKKPEEKRAEAAPAKKARKKNSGKSDKEA